MNVFEDLITQLKEENLLEKTVIDTEKDDSGGSSDLEAWNASGAVDDDPIEDDTPRASMPETTDVADVEIEGNDVVPAPDPETNSHKKPNNGSEFYKKRAVGEVSNLQMVEHVLTGVEREYLKIVPKSYDDFDVKKALNTFLQIAEGEDSDAHASAEFVILQETESWCIALSERDKNVPVSCLRQYCENSRPALSSQALVALARFYRNLPYTESVRAKFDFIMTRLFSRPVDGQKRISLFTRDETIAHVNMLYREWASIPLYDAAQDDSNVLLTAMSFDDLANEASQADSFDQLVTSEFFARLRAFKESVNELFYAPMVIAAAIASNLSIGNTFVDLIGNERKKADTESLMVKYSEVDDQGISDVAAQTLGVNALLKKHSETNAVTHVAVIDVPDPTPKPKGKKDRQSDREEVNAKNQVASSKKESQDKPAFVQKIIDEIRTMNRWFLAFAFLLVAASVGIYVYSTIFLKPDSVSAGVQVVELDGSALTQYVQTARISGNNFYGIVPETWDGLSKEKRQDALKVIFDAAKEKGCTQVTLFNKQGKGVGFASANRLDAPMP